MGFRSGTPQYGSDILDVFLATSTETSRHGKLSCPCSWSQSHLTMTRLFLVLFVLRACRGL